MHRRRHGYSGASQQYDCRCGAGGAALSAGRRTAAVSSGLVKIEEGEVLLLVDTAERPEDIDANRAKRAADAAKEELLQKHSIQEYGRAQANLARAISRLRVKERWHGSN